MLRGHVSSKERTNAERISPVHRIAVLRRLITGGVTAATAAPRGPVWQVYAIRYATLPKFPVRVYLVAGADTTRTVDIAMMFWLLEGPDRRRVLVDAGLPAEVPRRVETRRLVRPSEAVRALGLSDRIDHRQSIVSHVHWDHWMARTVPPTRVSGSRREESRTTSATTGCRARRDRHAGLRRCCSS